MQMICLDVLCALHWLGIVPKFLYEEIAGLVDALLDSNRVGSRCDSLP